MSKLVRREIIAALGRCMADIAADAHRNVIIKALKGA